MEYRTLDQLRQVATLHPDDGSASPDFLTKQERLDRWVALLERDPDRVLETLFETEHRTADVRTSMRRLNSPLSVAFEDPVLRSAGLKDDSYGEAKRFFGLSHGDMHSIVCYCHHGSRMTAHAAATRIRGRMAIRRREGVLSRAWRFLTNRRR